MKKYVIIALVAAFCLMSALAGCNKATVGNSTLGVNGALPTAKTSLILEEQNITYHIVDFPDYRSEEESAVSTVTTAYKMYNPDSLPQTVTLALPIGNVPAYFNGNRDELWKDVRATVADAPAEITVRHTFGALTDSVREVTKIRDSFAQSGVYSYDATVTQYVYEVNTDAYYNSRVWAKSFHVGEDSAVVLPNGLMNFDGTDYFICGDRQFSVYVVGQPIDDAAWVVYEQDGGQEIACTLLEKNTMTLGELVMENYREGSDILPLDWFNILVDMFASGGKIFKAYDLTEGALGGRYSKWYTFDVTVPAGEYAQAAVTAPTFPSIISHSNNPDRFEYSYNLNLSSQWAGVSAVTVKLDTRFPLVEKNEWGFVATDGGYASTKQFGGEEQPQGNITFSLSTGNYVNGRLTNLDKFLIVMLVIVALPPVVAIIIAIIMTVKKRKTK